MGVAAGNVPELSYSVWIGLTCEYEQLLFAGFRSSSWLPNSMKALSLVILLGATLPYVARAAVPEYKLVIRNHTYQPATLKVPANAKFKLLVSNEDATPSEFESNDFNREQIVLRHNGDRLRRPAGSRGYTFFDDFHRATGNGVLVVQ